MIESALNFSQQDDVFNPKNVRPVTLIGVGEVGSQVAVMLAKIGVQYLTVFDADAVESHNVPMSAYRKTCDLGKLKVVALAEIIFEQSELRITGIPKMYVGEKLRGSVVACVDTMEARMCIWDQVKMNPNVDVFVDTRMVAELISVFAINPCDPDDIAYYEHFLYPSNVTRQPTCGRHGIVYVSAAAAVAVCANLTRKWSTGNVAKRHHKGLVGGLQFLDQ